MSDQCQHCAVRGDIERCLQTKCHHHENWISEQHQLRLDMCRADLDSMLFINKLLVKRCKELRERMYEKWRENTELQRTLDNRINLDNWMEQAERED